MLLLLLLQVGDEFRGIALPILCCRFEIFDLSIAQRSVDAMCFFVQNETK
jgi:hypothetical protein